MRVVCSLSDIKNDLKLSVAYLAHVLGMDRRSVERLLADHDDDPWRLDRGPLHRLLLFAHEHGYEAFRFEPHELWATFMNDPEIVIFRAPSQEDTKVERHLQGYFNRLDSVTHTSTAPPQPGEVEEVMRRKNVVIIGSPKSNPACEIALARLWQAEPFATQAGNRARVPVHFLGMSPDPGAKGSAMLEASTRHGFNIKVPGGAGRRFLRVDWVPPDRFPPAKFEGYDAALVVACRRPLGTEADVSTVVLAGYTALATLTAAEQATHRPPAALAPSAMLGMPAFALLRFRFTKRAPPKRPISEHLRILDDPSVRWAPPWNDSFFKDQEGDGG
jgi:hypothetical protein